MVWMVWLQQPLPPSQARPSLGLSCGGPAGPVIFFCSRAPTSVHRLPLFIIVPHTKSYYSCTYRLHIHTTTATSTAPAITVQLLHILPASPPLPQTGPETSSLPARFQGSRGPRHGLLPSLPSRGHQEPEIPGERLIKPLSNSGTVDTQPATRKKCHCPADLILPHTAYHYLIHHSPPATVSVGVLNSFPFAGGWWPVWATERRGSRNLAV